MSIARVTDAHAAGSPPDGRVHRHLYHALQILLCLRELMRALPAARLCMQVIARRTVAAGSHLQP